MTVIKIHENTQRLQDSWQSWRIHRDYKIHDNPGEYTRIQIHDIKWNPGTAIEWKFSFLTNYTEHISRPEIEITPIYYVNLRRSLAVRRKDLNDEDAENCDCK